MNIIKTPIEGLLVIEPDVFRDSRGFFLETYNASRYMEAGISAHFIQDNTSMSTYGVVRGLHFQKGEWVQAKLVSCAVGSVLESEKALFNYKCDNPYHKEAEGGILLSDSDLGIDWRIAESDRILSDKDKAYLPLRETRIEF